MSDPSVITKEIAADIFTRAASQYDRTGPRMFERFGARLIELMPIAAGARVLDVATGRGAALLPAAHRVGTTGRVVGIDLAPGMLAELARTITLSNIQVCQMDAEHLEFADDSFDALTCAFALFFFPAMDVALREMWRVCQPGGHLGITLFGDTPPPFEPAWRMLAEQTRAYGVAMRTPQRIVYNAEAVRELLTNAGWRDITLHIETADLVYAHEEEWWQFQFTLGPRAALERMDDTTRARFREEYLNKLRPWLRDDGLHLRVSVIYAIAQK